MYDDVTLCMMMWHYVWWCDTMYDDVTQLLPLDVVEGVTYYLDILRQVVEAGVELEDEDEALEAALEAGNAQ